MKMIRSLRSRLLFYVQFPDTATSRTNATTSFTDAVSGAMTKAKSQLTVGLCCFLLGALTMFVLMTCCFDRVPTSSRTMLASSAAVSMPPKMRVMPLQPQDLDGVRSPADLMTSIRQQPSVVVKPEVQETVLRAFSLERPEGT